MHTHHALRNTRAVAIAIGVVALFASTTLVSAQSIGSGEPGRRALLPRAEEIALARSAAPASVSDSAEVWILAGDRYELAEPGSNGVACLVSRDWLASLEPICYDAEAAATIMRIGMRRTELLHGGRSLDATNAQVSSELASGALRLPRRPALAYMMSAAQKLISDDGTPVGAWKPHLMLYYPYITAADLGLSGQGDPQTVMLSGSGGATSVMIFVLSDFVQPRMPG